MKQKLLFLFIALAMGSFSFSQCGKKCILSATGTEILNDQNEVQLKDTLRITTIKYDSKNLEINSEYSTIYGTIDSIYCNWKLPFKEGTTYIHGILNFENGDQRITRLSIYGKDGKLTLLVDIEHPEANKMRFVLDKYKENN